MSETIKSSNALVAVTRDKPFYPIISAVQQGYWLINNLSQSKAAHHQFYLYQITGTIKTSLLVESIRDAIDRHEIFRTAFSMHNDELCLSITGNNGLVKQFDLENDTGDVQGEKISRITKEFRESPFDLSKGGLVRTAVINTKSDQCLLLIVQHMLTMDNDSDRIFLNDILEFYRAKLKERAHVLPELPIQFLDYAVWRTHSLQRKMLNRDRAYWKDALENAPPILPLVIDYPRLNVLKERCEKQCFFKIPPGIQNTLIPFIRQLGISLAAFFLSVYYILLYRRSFQPDILVGIPYSIRNRLELQNILGCFINTLIIRTRIDPDMPFVEFIKEVNKNSMAAYAHGNLPLEKVVEIVNPKRNILYNPLIQVLFNFEYLEKSAEQSGGDFEITRLSLISEELKYDLHLAMRGNVDQDIDCIFLYDANLFTPGTIGKMKEELLDFVKSVLEDPCKKIYELKTIAQNENDYITRTFINKQAQCTGANFVTLLEKNVVLTPGKPAIVHEGKSVSYAELNKAANRLSFFLIKKGIKAGDVAAVWMSLSVDFFISLLAILKTGAAYLIIPDEEPAENIKQILNVVEAKLVITSGNLNSKINFIDLENIDLKNIQKLLIQEEDINPGNDYKNISTACLQYFTNTEHGPAAFKFSHASLIACYEMLSGPLSTSHGKNEIRSGCFPFTIAQDAHRYLIQLFNGHCLVLFTQAPFEDINLQIKSIQKAGIDVFECYLSHLKLLLSSGLLKDNSHTLRKLMVIADNHDYMEIIDAPCIKELDCYLIFRAAECAQDISITRVSETMQNPAICLPAKNLALYILDEQHQLLPPGLPGQLFIPGNVLAEPYKNNISITQDQFIKNPLNGHKDEHLFNTGYAAQYLPGGKLEILRQTGKTNTSIFSIRSEYIDAGNNHPVQEHVTGAAVARIISQILNLEMVGVNDNFFDLGGHSLALAQLIFKIKKEFNIELEIQEIFIAREVSRIAKLIENKLNIIKNQEEMRL